jgi:surface antigen
VQRAVVVCIVAAGLAAPAGAQINPFGPYSGDYLTTDDRRLAEEASSKVYRAQAPSIGATQSWANSASGNSGTITLIKVHDYHGMPCRTLEHRVQIKERTEPVVFHLDRCRTETGEWKIL